MEKDQLWIGIDFGTTNCRVAWYNPESKKAEVIKNLHGDEMTPSIVFFEDGQARVGKPAYDVWESAEDDPQILQCLVTSIKRNLINPSKILLPGDKSVTPVEVVAQILGELKRDVEEGHFHRKVEAAVITCPAVYDTRQKGVISKAAGQAGFTEVKMLEEPVAAALAFAREGLNIGQGIVVYDLGGGTFDLAYLIRHDDGSFDVAMKPEGDPKCGGDDFDQALYNFLDKRAQEQTGLSFSPSPGTINKGILRRCREGKESLSGLNNWTFSRFIKDKECKIKLDRLSFEGLINEQVEKTVRKTDALFHKAQDEGHEVDTIVLIGGSAKIPLIKDKLSKILQIEPLKWKDQGVAVALGAAYYAASQQEKAVIRTPGKTLAWGRLQVNAKPQNATINFLNFDNEFSQGIELPPGKYHVEVSAEGHEAKREWVEIKAGEKHQINIELTEEKAYLSVDTDPKKARVNILNYQSPYSPGMELEPGKYHLEISADGYETSSEHIELEPGEDKHLIVNLLEKTINQFYEKGTREGVAPGAAPKIDSLINHLKAKYRAEYEVQAIALSDKDVSGKVFQMMSQPGKWNAVKKWGLGMGVAATATLIERGNDLEVKVDRGKWIDRAAVATGVSLTLLTTGVLFGLPFITMTIGIIKQYKVLNKLFEDIKQFLT